QDNQGLGGSLLRPVRRGADAPGRRRRVGGDEKLGRQLARPSPLGRTRKVWQGVGWNWDYQAPQAPGRKNLPPARTRRRLFQGSLQNPQKGEGVEHPQPRTESDE